MVDYSRKDVILIKDLGIIDGSRKIAAVVTSHTNGTLMVRVNGYSQVKEW